MLHLVQEIFKWFTYVNLMSINYSKMVEGTKLAILNFQNLNGQGFQSYITHWCQYPLNYIYNYSPGGKGTDVS